MSINLNLFYFPSDPSHARMGTHHSCLVGLDAAGGVYMGHGAPEPFDASSLPPMVRDTSLDASYPVKRLLADAKPMQLPPGQLVDAGMGNWGTCMGVFQIDPA